MDNIVVMWSHLFQDFMYDHDDIFVEEWKERTRQYCLLHTDCEQVRYQTDEIILQTYLEQERPENYIKMELFASCDCYFLIEELNDKWLAKVNKIRNDVDLLNNRGFVKGCEAKEGRKDDNDKLRWNLLPTEPVEEIVKVLMFGAKKYGDDNWKSVGNGKERYYNAAMRHLAEYAKGNLLDEESGLTHTAHAGCCLLFLTYLEWKDV